MAAAVALGCCGGSALAAPVVEWTSGPNIDPAANTTHPVTGLSCTPTGFCLAVDSVGRTFVWRGSWRGAAGINRVGGHVEGVSCVSSSFCVAISSTATSTSATSYVDTWTGTGWKAPLELYHGTGGGAGYSTVRGVSCTSSSFCIAVGGQVGSMVFDGARWTRRAGRTSGTDGQGVVNCASSKFCVNVHDGNANYWNGLRWRWTAANSTLSSGAIPGLASFVYGVSCVSARFCAAADLGGAPLIWNGRTWRASPQSPTGPTGFDTVSCTSSSFCVAGGETGRLAAWDGTSWSVTGAAHLPTGPVLVSCTKTGRCLGVSSDGRSAVARVSR